MEESSKPITIQDVALRAGVSRATVSRVLNSHPSVAPDLRLRVQEAINALGYQPNRTARRLRANSSDVLGLIIPDIQNPVFVSVARGVEDEAYKHQMNVVLCNTDDNAAKQQAYLRILQSEQAGVIVAPTHSYDGEALRKVRDAGIAIVLIDRRLDDFETDTVLVDNVRGAALAVRHLVELGYQRIAMIAGLQTLSPGRERLEGYRQALLAAGREIDSELIAQGDFREQGGYEQMRRLMSLPNPPDAIFSSNSLTSLGMLRALRDLGLRAPQDVALVGFDDLPYADYMCPALPAVVQPPYEIGRQAVQLLLRRLQEPDPPATTIPLQPRLSVRQSCGAALRQQSK